jgi:hypothetical protein
MAYALNFAVVKEILGFARLTHERGNQIDVFLVFVFRGKLFVTVKGIGRQSSEVFPAKVGVIGAESFQNLSRNRRQGRASGGTLANQGEACLFVHSWESVRD